MVSREQIEMILSRLVDLAALGAKVEGRDRLTRKGPGTGARASGRTQGRAPGWDTPIKPEHSGDGAKGRSGRRGCVILEWGTQFATGIATERFGIGRD